MPGNRTANENVIFFSENFHYFQSFHFHPVATHAARHTHPFKHSAGIRRVTNRAGRPLPVMLAMALLAYATKAMALYHTLKSFTLGGAYYFYAIAFGKYVNRNGFANLFRYFAIAYFFYYFFGSRIGFGEVIYF